MTTEEAVFQPSQPGEKQNKQLGDVGVYCSFLKTLEIYEYTHMNTHLNIHSYIPLSTCKSFIPRCMKTNKPMLCTHCRYYTLFICAYNLYIHVPLHALHKRNF